jgi:hypothetical protein
MVSKVTKTVDATFSGGTPASSNRTPSMGNTPGSAQPGQAMSPGSMHISTPIANGSPGGSAAGLAHTEAVTPSAGGPAAGSVHGSTPGEGKNFGPAGSTGGGK